MPQIVNLLMLFTGLIITGFGWAIFRGSPILFATLPLGIGLVVAAIIGDKRRAQREKEKQSADIANRITQLTQAPWSSQQTLEIKTNKWPIVLVLIVGLLSILSIHVGLIGIKIVWPLVSGGAFFLLLSLLLLLISLVGFGKPACIFDRNGFMTPMYGQIAWQAVEGVALQQYTVRGVTHSILLFRVPNYQHVASDFHWLQRVFALFGVGAIKRDVVNVVLKESNEYPETVLAVGQFLWSEATGRNYEWVPTYSDAYNEAAKRVSQITRHPPDSDSLERRLQNNPQEVLDELEQVNNDVKLMNEERARRLARLNRTIIVTTILLLALLGLKLIK